MRIVLLPMSALLVALALTGCGGSAAPKASQATDPRCRDDRVAAAHALVRLRRDVADIRVAARTVPASAALKGNDSVNRATDRFLLDVATAPIDALARNRLIDHAMSALVGSCEQCFQALEAERPIPAIKQAGRCGR